MSFYDNDYFVYVFLGDSSIKPIWFWNHWTSIMPKLSELILLCRDKATIRSDQYYSSNGKLIRFGKMQWSDKSNQKWTHGSPSSDLSEFAKFLSSEIWAPSWSQCEKENLSPDLFLSINNESLRGNPEKKYLFNPVIILAIASKLAIDNQEIIQTLVEKISTTTNAKYKVFKERKWGYEAKGLNSYSTAILDLGVCGLFKPGNRHDRSIDLETFAEEWSEF